MAVLHMTLLSGTGGSGASSTSLLFTTATGDLWLLSSLEQATAGAAELATPVTLTRLWEGGSSTTSFSAVYVAVNPAYNVSSISTTAVQSIRAVVIDSNGRLHAYACHIVINTQGEVDAVDDCVYPWWPLTLQTPIQDFVFWSPEPRTIGLALHNGSLLQIRCSSYLTGTAPRRPGTMCWRTTISVQHRV